MLSGKNILVTGAGTGIGAATAIAAGGEGAAVAIVGRRTDLLAETARQAKDKGAAAVLPIGADLTRPDDVAEVITRVLDEFGGVDGLVNNAGIGRFAPIEDADLADLDHMYALHVRGPAQLIQGCVPSLRARHGAIVNVTSVAGQLSAPRRSFYGATKAAMTHLSNSLAKELAPDVRVNAILPGPVDTPIYDRLELPPEKLAALRADMVAMTPMGRFGLSEEVAVWVCRLLDDSASWVTGVVLPIDGGRCV